MSQPDGLRADQAAQASLEELLRFSTARKLIDEVAPRGTRIVLRISHREVELEPGEALFLLRSIVVTYLRAGGT